MIMQCEDLDECLQRLAQNTDNQQWQALMADYFDTDVHFDGEGTIAAKKIFDLKEQLQGFLGE